MAEDRPVVRNKGMLLVALLLGVVTVILYNVQVGRVRSEALGETVYLLEFRRNVGVNEELDIQKDLAVTEVRKQFEDKLGDVVFLEDPSEKSNFRNSFMKAPAKLGDFLQYSHISSQRHDLPSSQITPGWVAVSVPVEKEDAPGDILRVGDYVNLLGVVSLPNKQPTTYRLLTNARVLAVGGKGLQQTESTKRGLRLSDAGQRAYRWITIELPLDESLLLRNVLTHVQGTVAIELMNFDSARNQKPEVPAALRGLKANPAGRGITQTGPGGW